MSKVVAKINVFTVLQTDGLSGLKSALVSLTHRELKDIIKLHRFAATGNCLGWKDSDKNKEKLIKFIILRTHHRSVKGDVFRKY